MNPEDQADLEAIFGKDALRKKAREISDRRAEGWARRKGSALPDMRRGVGAKPVDPRDSAGDDGPPALINPQGLPATAVGKRGRRLRLEVPAVEPAVVMEVPNLSGKARNYRVALNAEEYAEKLAELDARASEQPAAQENSTWPTLPISEEEVPARLRPTDETVKDFALKTQWGSWRPTSPQERRRRRDEYRAALRSEVEMEIEMEDLVEEGDADFDDGYSIFDEDVDDRSQWEIDHAVDAAEDWRAGEAADEAQRRAARDDQDDLVPWIEWIERDVPAFRYYPEPSVAWKLPPPAPPDLTVIAGTAHLTRTVRLAEEVRETFRGLGITSPPDDVPFDASAGPRSSAASLCVHCKVDPIQTKKDGLCRPCKTYRTSHAGQLPPQKVIDARRRKREGQ